MRMGNTKFPQWVLESDGKQAAPAFTPWSWTHVIYQLGTYHMQLLTQGIYYTLEEGFPFWQGITSELVLPLYFHQANPLLYQASTF